MPSAAFALQKSIHGALTAAPALTGLLGGPHVYDDVPRTIAFPYVTFGLSSARDWDTGTDAGDEHTITLHAWSKEAGRKQTHALIHAIRGVLHDAALALDGHRLVNLRHEFSEARRDPDGETYHGIVRLRAVTEPTG